MGTVKALLVFVCGYRYAMRIALPKASALVQAESSSGILAGGRHHMLRQPEYELWRRMRSNDNEERTYIRRVRIRQTIELAVSTSVFIRQLSGVIRLAP